MASSYNLNNNNILNLKTHNYIVFDVFYYHDWLYGAIYNVTDCLLINTTYTFFLIRTSKCGPEDQLFLIATLIVILFRR